MGTKVIDQILTKMLHGSSEEKHYIYNESEIILECKLCRNLFRALTGFILHRKSLCLKPIEKSLSVSAYDQSMRSETFKNVTFITSISSPDQQPLQQHQQPQENLTREIADQTNFSTDDHFQYLESYVSQINESIENKSNLKAVLNLTQTGIADSNSKKLNNMADDRSKVLDDYAVQISSPVETCENPVLMKKKKPFLTNHNSPQSAETVCSPQGPSDSSTELRTDHKNIVQSQNNGFHTKISSDQEGPSEGFGESCQGSTSLLKITSVDSGSGLNVLDEDSEQDELSKQSFAAAQQILASNIGTVTSTIDIGLTSNATSSSSRKRKVEPVTDKLTSNASPSTTQIILDDNLDSKNVIEIDELDSLEERVTESLSLDNLVYVNIDESSSLNPDVLQTQQQEQTQHYVCSYCPNTLIYDSYMLFRQHLVSVHGIQYDSSSDPSGQALSSEIIKHHSSSGGVHTERSSQKSSDDIVLELADFQKLQCRKCKHSFTQRCSLRRHILEIHSERHGYYSCPFCTNKVWFRYFRTFLAHLKNLHGFQKDQIYRIHQNLQKNSWVEFGSEQLPTERNLSRNFQV